MTIAKDPDTKQRESLRTLLRDLVEQHGEPAPEDVAWAQRALAPSRGSS